MVMSVRTKLPTPAGLTFGSILRHWRNARGLGLVDVANQVGIDPTLLSRIETDKRYPPELPVLVKLAKVLSIDEGSEDFDALLMAADRASNPALHDMASAMRGGKAWNPFAPDLMNELPPVFCGTLAEMVARATERAISTGAVSITVKSEDGAVQKFQVLEGQKLVKKRRRD
jgi:transcriptional regulator with XRE-family HTH domain